MKKYRIKKGYEFRRALRRGRWKQAKDITIYIVNNNLKFNRLGICVTKKNGNSVERNKLKRWIREAYRNVIKENEVKKALDIVIMYKKGITVLDTNYNEVYKQITAVLNDLKLYEIG